MSKIDPQFRLSAPKFQKIFFAYLSTFLYFWEKIKRYHLSNFEYLSYNSPKLNQNYYWLWVYFGFSVSNGQIRITVLNYTVALSHTWTLNLYMSASYLNSDYYQVHFFSFFSTKHSSKVFQGETHCTVYGRMSLLCKVQYKIRAAEQIYQFILTSVRGQLYIFSIQVIKTCQKATNVGFVDKYLFLTKNCPFIEEILIKVRL